MICTERTQVIGRLITRRDVLLPSLISAVGQYVSWAISFGFMAVLVKQLGGTGVTQSLFVTLNIAMTALGNLVTTWMVHRIGARRWVIASFVLMFTGIGIASFAPTLGILVTAQICLGLAQGFGYPVLMGMSIQQVTDAERSTAMGVHQAVYAIGMFAGPALSGVIAQTIGIQPMFGITAFASLALGLLGARWLDGKQTTL